MLIFQHCKEKVKGRRGREETELLKSYGLTPAQFNVLRILRGAGAEGLVCRDIGERMLAYDPDVTQLLDPLEARGLVKRERQVEDRRAILARITPKGISTLETVDRPMLDLVARLLGHLGGERCRH